MFYIYLSYVVENKHEISMIYEKCCTTGFTETGYVSLIM